MNARERHLLNEQNNHDAQQRKADAVPPLCVCGGNIKARNMCSSCYSKWLRKNNPEHYERQKEQQRIYRKEHPEDKKNWNKRWRDKNPEAMRAIHKRYFAKYPEQKEKALQRLEDLKVGRVCSALKKHAEDLKDDPERLSTEYILNISKIKKRRSKRQLFCTLHGTTCTPDDEGFAGCGGIVSECSWVSDGPRSNQ